VVFDKLFPRKRFVDNIFNIKTKIYDRLKPGTWILAHDVTHRYISNQYDNYLKFVRDDNYFKKSICFDLDLYGLELSIK